MVLLYHYALTAALQLCWVMGICMFRCNLPAALLAEQSQSFTCHCSNMGVEQTLNNNHHTKLTLENKILPPLLPGFELATFRLQVRHSNQQAIPAPEMCKNIIYSFWEEARVSFCNRWPYRGTLTITQTCIISMRNKSTTFMHLIYSCDLKIWTRSQGTDTEV